MHKLNSLSPSQPRESKRWSPKDVHVLIPRISEYVTLHGKKDSVDVIWLHTLRLSGWAQYSHRSAMENEAAESALE